MRPSSWTASIIRMDQAVPFIPTGGMYYRYAPPRSSETVHIPKDLDRSDCGNDPLETSYPPHQAGWDLWEGL